MTTNRKMAGGSAGRTLGPRSWARPPGLALLAMALVGLVQTGCRSDGCTNCNLGSKISNGVQALTARVTKHFDGCGGGGDCGCGGSETIVDSGIPVISGGMVVPGPGTLIPSPIIDQPPTQLDPIPSGIGTSQPTSGTTTSPSSTRSTPSGANKSSYTTMIPKGTTAQRRPADVSRAIHSDPEVTASTDLLDNIPPVDLPSEITKNAAAAPKPVPVATPAASPSPTANATTPNTTPTPAEKVSAVEGAVGSLPPIDAPSPFQAPGLRRYASIAPSIAGGSSPSVEGLEWLKEKGYRTFIDLRQPSEVEPNFVEAVNDRNMVYISLPIVANRLDPSRLARFDDLVAQSENRPLYFCDGNGTRAGLVWYIHLRVVSQEDSQSATGKAEEIGLSESEAKLAEAYLLANKPRARAAMARVASVAAPKTSEITPEPAPAAPATPPPVEVRRSALPEGVSPTSDSSTPNLVPAPLVEPAPSMLPGEDRPQASRTSTNDRFRDPAFWRPVAALVLTAIGVPLACWSRSTFNVARSTRARASLPGSVLPPSGVPAGSDA